MGGFGEKGHCECVFVCVWFFCSFIVVFLNLGFRGEDLLARMLVCLYRQKLAH